MTFTSPDDSKARLIRACQIVNADPAVREIEEELDSLKDEIAEPWENVRPGEI